MPGFYDGDGLIDVAVWRPSTGDWITINSAGGYTHQQWGQTGDIPVPADYDNDGRTDFAIWRPSTGDWWVLTRTNQVIWQQWGQNGDVPVPADYDGDGRIDFAIWRPSTGVWRIKIPTVTVLIPAPPPIAVATTQTTIFSSTGSVVTSEEWSPEWGRSGDIPVPADYDHDGRTDLAIWRPSTGNWSIWLSTSTDPRENVVTDADTGIQWGQTGDVPIKPGPRYR